MLKLIVPLASLHFKREYKIYGSDKRLLIKLSFLMKMAIYVAISCFFIAT
jgi:hypothetical protein